MKNQSYQEAKANLALAYRIYWKIERSLNIYKKLNFHGPWSLKARFNYGITLITIRILKRRMEIL